MLICLYVCVGSPTFTFMYLDEGLIFSFTENNVFSYFKYF